VPDNDLYAPLLGHLSFLYGAERAAAPYKRLSQILEQFRQAHPELLAAPLRGERVTERDVVLITYGDQLREPGRPPLQTLGDMLFGPWRGIVSAVHILPFYPYSSDDGFSVIDYTAVDPDLGSWDDIARLRPHARLMFDAVVNHISAESAWFQAFLRGEPGAERRFIAMDPATDLSRVTRPRTTPLLTRFETARGPRYIWTTFSADQIDLDFRDPELLIEIVQVLLNYVGRGAELIRLDAIGYLWKEAGTRCIHLPQTHRIVKLFRSVLDLVAPHALLITETNVPHQDNISYFGDGADEAQLVYQFPLAPLVLHAFATGSARYLSEWAIGLAPPSDSTTFFNFLASHDGIGVVPATGILGPAAIAALAARAEAHGGYVSYKTNPDGSQSPYELNITLFDALSDPQDQAEPAARKIDRFVAANAIMLALPGVPGVYVHSLVGSHSYHAGVQATGRFRSINREKWDRAELERRLADPTSDAHRVFERMSALIAARRGHAAFHPNGPQRLIAGDERLFAVLRAAPDGREHVLCIQNVSDQPCDFQIEISTLPELVGAPLRDLIGGRVFDAAWQHGASVPVAPYEVLWLAAGG
jgi:sucrose phosphorylase